MIQKNTSNMMNISAVFARIGKLLTEILIVFAAVGVFHGDLKENNVMVVFEPENGNTIHKIKLKVIDFGLAELFINESQKLKRLVTFDPQSRKFNYIHLQTLDEKVSKRFENKDGVACAL